MKGLGRGLRKGFVSSALVSLKKENKRSRLPVSVCSGENQGDGAPVRTSTARTPIVLLFPLIGQQM